MNFQRNQVRVNHRIRVSEVRVIDENGVQVGILSTAKALKLATDRGLDLVEIAPEAKPPVCRIVNFGKFRYEQAKKSKGSVKQVYTNKLKELKFHVTISDHDYGVKLRHATEFLQKGMRVKLSLFFRGREMHHQEFGMQLIQRALQDIAPYGHTDTPPRLLGKNLHVLLVPGKAKPKFSPNEAQPSQAKPLHPSPLPQPPQPSISIHSNSQQPDSPKPFGTNLKIDLKPVEKS